MDYKALRFTVITTTSLVIIAMILTWLINLAITADTDPPALTNQSVIALSEYNQIEIGTSYAQVVSIVGDKGELDSEIMSGQYHFTSYTWQNEDYSFMTLGFDHARVDSKSQHGLK